jgi:hypothetical protein
VNQGNDGYYSIDYAKLTPMLIEAIKAQQLKISELEKLSDDIENLKKVIEKLMAER